MRKCYVKAIILGGLISYAAVAFSSTQTSVSNQDRQWIKDQQKSLQQFKDSVRGQSMPLPTAQQNLVERLQNGMVSGQASAELKKTFPAIYFVSLGIPREGLIQMLRDANRYEIPATIRGLLANDFRKTASTMFELSKDDNNIGVQIDPTLFSEYGITAVPALVVTCDGKFDVIKGSLPLYEALEKIAEKGDCSATAKKLLETAK
ncbi:type-F conjugative transfer system pilin assembly protein TrbC [Pectobacterium brasiliense]|uniref:type-F conjugative transfer system pilin assembly protein TrbC n=1 Tax=Pectobacterium brasiliense TaxID=180957 RepID=UPI001968CDFE|nr:type-F conjugative transfer system pilin assembly protein TrbC [Pectobacterium brasiliense]MBN3262953.1 type-F conjugative transfer system pilin assembly protein TrbC [Pectobacterium brasiliense]